MSAANGVRQRTLAKARTLLEALPYIREHHGATMVIKVGGAVMEQAPLADAFAQDIALIRLAGVHPVVVHGGGPQISAVSERLGLTPRFVDGLRVTDRETLEVARMVLVGTINKDLVGRIVRQGVGAAGISGEDAALLTAAPKAVADGGDLGFVGEVSAVNPAILRTMMREHVPVVATTAADAAGQPYNVNADEAAAAIAVAVGATKLVFLTDVPGVYDEGPDGIRELRSELSLDECTRMVDSGVAGGGMAPKLRAVVEAMRGGVRRTHLIDGRVPHALILELFTPEGLGTMVVPEADAGAESGSHAPAVAGEPT